MVMETCSKSLALRRRSTGSDDITLAQISSVRQHASSLSSRQRPAPVTCSLYLARHTSSSARPEPPAINTFPLLRYPFRSLALILTCIKSFDTRIWLVQLETCQPTCSNRATAMSSCLRAATWFLIGAMPMNRCPVRATWALAVTSTASTSCTTCR